METTAPSASPVCPKCSHPAPEGAIDCPACGIVYAKYRAPGEALVPAASDAAADGDLFNPYAPPEANLRNVPGAEPGAEEGIWRSGKLLVMSKAATLPHRCVRCNLPAQIRLHRKLSWHKPLIYLAALISLLLYLILFLMVRKKAEIDVPLCHEHDRARKTWLAIGSFLFLGGGALILYGFGDPALAGHFVIGLFAGLAGLFILAVYNQPLRPKKIDDEHAWLTNASADFLATLPDAPTHLTLQ